MAREKSGVDYNQRRRYLGVAATSGSFVVCPLSFVLCRWLLLVDLVHLFFEHFVVWRENEKL